MTTYYIHEGTDGRYLPIYPDIGAVQDRAYPGRRSGVK